MKNNLEKLKNYFGLNFNNEELLIQAMTHPSYANEFDTISNQRLEFIGDAVIDLAVGKFLYELMSGEDEGGLTKKRAQEVCEGSLSEFAKSFDLGQYLFLGKGEDRNQGREKQAVLADAFEAFIGAIFLDKGFNEVYKVLNKVVFPEIKKNLNQENNDYKSKLQELVQSDKRTLVYEIISESGPAHDRTFVARVTMDDGIRMGEGTGKTKKEAEQDAAKNTLEKLAPTEKIDQE